jgi:hypothetical protein
MADRFDFHLRIGTGLGRKKRIEYWMMLVVRKL